MANRDNTVVSVQISSEDIRTIHALMVNARVFIHGGGGADDEFRNEYGAHIERANLIIDRYLDALGRKKKQEKSRRT